MEQKWTNEQIDQLIRVCGISREEMGAMLNLTREQQSFNRKLDSWSGTTALLLHFLREDLSELKGYEVVDGLLSAVSDEPVPGAPESRRTRAANRKKASHGFD